MRSRRRLLTVLMCGALALVAAGCSSDGGTASSTTAPTGPVPSSRPAGAPPLDPFHVGELIGLGNWQLSVEPPTVSLAEIRVPVRLLNKHLGAARLRADGVFTLRDGTAGADIVPASIEGLTGRVASNATASGVVVFRPSAPVPQPVLYFHGRPLDANSAYVALT